MADPILLSFAFAAGFAAFFNPCGFAVLVAYISHFFNLRDAKTGRKRSIFNGLVIGAIATLGFITVFSVAGFLIAFVSRSVIEIIPWVNLALGLLLIGIGAYLLTGRTISFNIRAGKLNTKQTSSLSFYKFGLIYAFASFGCVLPVFISVVISGVSTGSIADGTSVFLAYSLGMGLIMTIVSVALATSRSLLMDRIKRFARQINKVNALILIALGMYLTYFQLVNFIVV